MLGLDYVQEDVTSVVTLPVPVAEPLFAALLQAFDHSLYIVHSAVGTCMWRQRCEVERLL